MTVVPLGEASLFLALILRRVSFRFIGAGKSMERRVRRDLDEERQFLERGMEFRLFSILGVRILFSLFAT